MICPCCQAETGDDSGAFCPFCGCLLSGRGDAAYVTPTASESSLVISLSPEPASAPASKRPFTTTQKLAVVSLSLVMALLAVGVGVVGYATLASPKAGFDGMPDIVPVTINDRAFPDEVFRNYVAVHYDLDADGTLSAGEIAAVEEIGRIDESAGNVIDPGVSALGIETLEGVQYFVNLKTLICSDNEIRHIDVSQNKNLDYLDCENNAGVTIDVSSDKPPAKIEKDDDATVNKIDPQPNGVKPEESEAPSDSTTVPEDSAKSNAPVQVESALVQRCGDALYEGGILAGAVDAGGEPVKVSFGGLASPGCQTSAFVISEQTVFFLEPDEADPAAAALCSQILGSDGDDKEVLAESVSAVEPFYRVGDSLFFRVLDEDGAFAGASADAVRDAGGGTAQKAPESLGVSKPTGSVVRMSLENNEVEKIDSVRRIVGATNEAVYFTKADGSTVYRCNEDLSQETKMEGMEVPEGVGAAYHLCDDGNLWALVDGATSMRLSVVDPDGNSVLEKDIEGAPRGSQAWSDGAALYVATAPQGHAETRIKLLCIDLTTGEEIDSASLAVGEAESARPLYVDGDACYMLVEGEKGSADVAADLEKSDADARVSSVVRFDRAKDSSETLATWSS